MNPLIRPLASFALAALFLSLSGCSNDGAAYLINGSRHAISIERKQDYFWEKQYQYAVVVSRLPDCQRKHYIQKAGAKARLELWTPGSHTYILRIGKNAYITEAQHCEGFARLDADPPGGYGEYLGTFVMKNDVFSFVPEEKVEETPASAPSPAQ
ncbi:MAG: hypothetical protein LBR88_08155 [Zoogloeaceae bacterium]|jgi:hypothetical protein|nr:hypothetical protein [Zoogloeaceae bacterium]